VNSLDAIIAMCVLLTTFSIFLGVISTERTQLENSTNQINAKINAQNCATIIDSMFVNGAEEYNGELNCGGKENELTYTTKGETKSAKTIAKIEKKEGLQVKMNEHYKN
jgi:hypothetical protein